LQGYDMLELTAISKSFADVQVLDSLNLSVAPGSRTAIVGPSGQVKPRCCVFLPGLKRRTPGVLSCRANAV
jgi:iron(III) transport system ATP-binding protein